ncbi:hypothetical protein OPT61_g7949 [Boeremia exigua]|uniref:Uncharacterized protein n=1 Tax=Boeremia exigua TaxID=749465 RepID=A0ACC2I1A5_9PLEO|nr:hypothetical protein OPT61_g7949 [Boeremia exigua]
MDNSDSNERKRRRITPTILTTAPLVGTAAAEVAGPSTTPPGESGTWDYLSKWEAADDTVIGDIEEEEHYSDVSDGSQKTTEDADDESEEGDSLPFENRTVRPSKLGTAKVIETINDCIAMYSEAWRPGKDEKQRKTETGQAEVPVTYDPLKMWEEAEADGQREALAERYRLEAEFYRQRLDYLCNEIAQDPGDTNCKHLEVTVDLMERAVWLEGIYKLPPDTGSDDEAQDEDFVLAHRDDPPLTQPSSRSQYRNPPVQVIDLDALSDLSDSGDENVSIGGILTTPAQAINSNEAARSTQAHLSTPRAVVVNSIETPVTCSAVTASPAGRSQGPLDDAPENASISTVSRWNWEHLKETQDRKRVVSKAIYELSSADREMIRQKLHGVGRANMVREIHASVDMLLRGDRKLPGVLPKDTSKIITFANLFLCWWLCDNYFQKEPSQSDLAELASCLRQGSSDPATFCVYVDVVLSTTFSHAALNRATQPSQAEIIEISDDEQPPSQLPERQKSNTAKPTNLEKSAAIVID